jgi:PAS domain S-box-containing protein
VFAASPDAIMIFNLDGRIIDCNESAIVLHGYESKEEAVGKNILEHVAKKDHKLALKGLAQGLVKNLELTFVTKNGREYPAEVSGNVVLDALGKPAFFMAITKDITERKKMEEQLKANAENLESLLKQRTNELIEAEQLAAAGKVAAMLGHDLGSPIQTIKNSIYLLRESPGEAEEMLKEIDDAANRMITMVEELRANMRNPPFTPQKVDLGDFIGRCLKDASIPPGVTTHLIVGAGLKSVTLDPFAMRRVLDNLVRNAFEAMPRGGDLSVSAEVVGSDAVIKVSDTGVGIPKEMRATLFKAFNTSKSGGLGLGLAYCKRAVEAHGGVITVESNVDEGTTVMVKLPL